MKRSLTEMAVHRPVAAVMLTLTLVGLGVIAWNQLPLTFLPPADNPFVLCMFPYPGASPLQMEQQIALPVEGEFGSIPGLKRIETQSSMGICQVSLLFKTDADMTTVIGEIRDRIERLKMELPPDVERVVIQKFRFDSIPIMMTGMFCAGDRDQFAHLVRTVVQPRLQRIDGVANIEVFSPTSPREAIIEFEQNTLNSLNISLPEILDSLRDGYETLSIGILNADAMRYMVRYKGEYKNLEDIAGLSIGNRGMRIRDVADVRYAPREQSMRVKLDNQDGLIVLVHKESQANTVSTCRAVERELEALNDIPAFLTARVFVFFNQAEFIVKVLHSLFWQGLYGGIMAIAVMFLFLRRLLPTLLVAASIPLSLVFALVFMYFTGMTLNIVTLVSMIIAVGMLVDNAIVVVENIMRKHGKGMPVMQATLDGAREVEMAIIASTLTTWVVFLPMYFLEAGQMSVFLKQFGGPLFASLGGSLIIALTMAPLAMTVLLRNSGNSGDIFPITYSGPSTAALSSKVIGVKEGLTPPKQSNETILNNNTTVFGVSVPLLRSGTHGKIISAYGGLLRMCLRQRLVFMVGLILFIGASIAYPLKAVGMRALPNLDMRQISIEVTFDANMGMDPVSAMFARIEGEIEIMRDDLGIKNVFSYHDREGGSFSIYLYEEKDVVSLPVYATEEVVKILSQKIPARVPGAELKIAAAGAGESGTERMLSLTLRGDDPAALKQSASMVCAALKRVEGLQEVQVETHAVQSEIQVHIDAPRAHYAGITPMMVAQTVDAALRGIRLGYLKQGGREIPLWAQFREEDRRSQANLEMIQLSGNDAALSTLNQLTDYVKAPSPETIRRIQGKNTETITAAMTHSNLLEVKRKLNEILAQTELPSGCSLSFGDDIEELDQNLTHFTITVLMSVLLVYLVMCALFESWLFPFSIMTTVPMAFIGAVWMLYFTETPFDSISLIGCILLAGIVVNNGIVIVDHIRQTCQGETQRDEAIALAGMDRFRPVLMTAATTILGLLPMALVRTGGAATFSGLGKALIGGMICSTVLTLFVVPVIYGMLDDFSRWVRDFWGDLKIKTL